ncbi:hypothetical protein ACFQI7_30625 [Paenibacillus allorhizosphaerae]|uniref:MarR family transcriptional regulator n=1 Tax=Paenibacillus allorhizosphaerae TaxID=2849866 RepID=A0ABN7TRZ7_9BACL|nr:hypothetical protein [Paenibacillus allorhizosphaerae]CAG7653313.1 hypothetical protein PAECIP111802_05458 [Paenibacillus allorhizosphaerae]
MTTLTQTGSFSLNDFFKIPDLDIYQQMICIVLSTLTSEKSGMISVADIAAYGRMTSRQATSALQGLVDKKIVTHKAFREIVGDFGDDRLSWTAKGLLVYLKRYPHVTMEELAELSGQSGDDEQAVREALNDLKLFGYLDELTDSGALLTS